MKKTIIFFIFILVAPLAQSVEPQQNPLMANQSPSQIIELDSKIKNAINNFSHGVLQTSMLGGIGFMIFGGATFGTAVFHEITHGSTQIINPNHPIIEIGYKMVLTGAIIAGVSKYCQSKAKQ